MPHHEDMKIKANGLTHHLMVWPGETGQIPIVCLHGLTRNAKDFEELGPWLRDVTGRPVFALSFRGRGQSDEAPDPMSYVPQTYVDDLGAILDALEIEQISIVGTSLGGIVGMLFGAAYPARLERLVLNDVGPELAEAGLLRIAGYAGKVQSTVEDWAAAKDINKQINGVAFPGRDEAFWQKITNRLFVEKDGQVMLDYDQNIAQAFTAENAAPPLWPAFDRLICPLLSIRGALSDLLTSDIVDKMKASQPEMGAVDVAQTGHAPYLEEAEAMAALSTFWR